MTQRLLNRYLKACLIPVFFILLLVTGIRSTAASTDSSKAASKLITRFTFKILSGGVIIVNAALDPYTDSLNFILDTGSGGISLDSAIVDYYKLPKVPSDKMLRGIGSIRKVSYVKDRLLHFTGLDVDHLDFHINDYSLLTSVYGLRIDGIIGYSFLKQFIVKIDYDKHVIEVWSKGQIKYPRSGTRIKTNINNIPVFEATVADGTEKLSRFYFDSGAGLCLLLSEEFARDSSILRKGKKLIVTQAEGLGGKKAMQLTTVKEIKIGRYTFKKVPAHIFEDDYNITSYPFLGGLIGNDLLRRFNVILNYGENLIHLTPNTHFRDAFDYSYTGLGIYFVDGEIVIEDVLTGSPGEAAGLKPGDIIAAVDNHINGSIQDYKDMLQQVGARLKMLIIRKGEPLVIYLKVKSFLKETK